MILVSLTDWCFHYQVIAPGSAHQNSVISEGINELFVSHHDLLLLRSHLILISVAAWAVDRKGPPIIVGMVKLLIALSLIPDKQNTHICYITRLIAQSIRFIKSMIKESMAF